MPLYKNYKIISCILLLQLTSCTVFKKPIVTYVNEPEKEVSVKKAPIASATNGKLKPDSIQIIPSKPFDLGYRDGFFSVENAGIIQFRYSILLNIEIEQLANFSLYKFIENWWGTPYKMGGTTKQGIDCSGFVSQLFSSVYGMNVPRNSSAQQQFAVPINKNQIQEGDLVFFNTNRRKKRDYVSHVGIYLHNNKFVHASTSSGVMISDLTESYWEKHFVDTRRVK
jgi:hypothetical protein